MIVLFKQKNLKYFIAFVLIVFLHVYLDKINVVNEIKTDKYELKCVRKYIYLKIENLGQFNATSSRDICKLVKKISYKMKNKVVTVFYIKRSGKLVGLKIKDKVIISKQGSKFDSYFASLFLYIIIILLLRCIEINCLKSKESDKSKSKEK